MSSHRAERFLPPRQTYEGEKIGPQRITRSWCKGNPSAPLNRSSDVLQFFHGPLYLFLIDLV